MDKFDTLLLLDAASITTEMTMVGQLENMRQKGAVQAVMQKILAALRDWIFKYNEASKNVLDLEKKDPKQAAGAMRLLEYRLKKSGINPDWFFELGDKSYVSDTYRSIKDHVDRLNHKISDDENKEVQAFFEKVYRLEDYNYYLANYARLLQYRSALPKSKFLSSGARTIGIVLVLIGCLCGGFATLSNGIFSGNFGSGGGPSSSTVTMTLFTAVLCIGLPFVPGAGLAYFGHTGANAKKAVEQIGNSVDIDEMNSLDKEFQGNLQEVQNKKNEAQATFNEFFGGQSVNMP
jgi:hypothetical protein